MPIKALLDNEPLYSLAVRSEQEWNDIRKMASASKGRLIMPCCGTTAIPKTMRQSLNLYRFFAHKCLEAPASCPAPRRESPAHQRLKYEAMMAAKAANAEYAEVEKRQDDWVADVWITWRKINRIIEIQLSAQTFMRTVERTERYRRAGIDDVLWIMRDVPPGLEAQHEIPIIQLPKDTRKWLSLTREVTKLFTMGSLKWEPGKAVSVPVTLVSHPVLCQGCANVWDFTPYGIIRYSEVRGNMPNQAQGARWFPEDTFMKDALRLCCPECGREPDRSNLKPYHVLEYPSRETHGFFKDTAAANWSGLIIPPTPEPVPDGKRWAEILERHRLFVMPDEVFECRTKLRQEREARRRAEAEAAERDRLKAEAEAEARRQKAERARQAAAEKAERERAIAAAEAERERAAAERRRLEAEKAERRRAEAEAHAEKMRLAAEKRRQEAEARKLEKAERERQAAIDKEEREKLWAVQRAAQRERDLVEAAARRERDRLEQERVQAEMKRRQVADEERKRVEDIETEIRDRKAAQTREQQRREAEAEDRRQCEARDKLIRERPAVSHDPDRAYRERLRAALKSGGSKLLASETGWLDLIQKRISSKQMPTAATPQGDPLWKPETIDPLVLSIIEGYGNVDVHLVRAGDRIERVKFKYDPAMKHLGPYLINKVRMTAGVSCLPQVGEVVAVIGTGEAGVAGFMELCRFVERQRKAFNAAAAANKAAFGHHSHRRSA